MAAPTMICLVLVTFIVIGQSQCRNLLKTRVVQQSRTPVATQTFYRHLGKRALGMEKCSAVSACAMLQIQPGTSQYYVEEICQCGGNSACSLEWDENPSDGRSVNNADTQLKLCRPVFEMPRCMSDQPAVISTLETSIARPTIRQGAQVLCNCPPETQEYKLMDAGMLDEGDRTVVTAKFECVPVVHCRSLQPCKFLAVLPTGDNLTHYTCQCPNQQKCPSQISPSGIIPAKLDDIAYYPFFCQ